VKGDAAAKRTNLILRAEAGHREDKGRGKGRENAEDDRRDRRADQTL